jgi:hypothetical protein
VSRCSWSCWRLHSWLREFRCSQNRAGS